MISKQLLYRDLTNDLDYKFTDVVTIIRAKHHREEPVHKNGDDKYITTEKSAIQFYQSKSKI